MGFVSNLYCKAEILVRENHRGDIRCEMHRKDVHYIHENVMVLGKGAIWVRRVIYGMKDRWENTLVIRFLALGILVPILVSAYVLMSGHISNHRCQPAIVREVISNVLLVTVLKLLMNLHLIFVHKDFVCHCF